MVYVSVHLQQQEKLLSADQHLGKAAHTLRVIPYRHSHQDSFVTAPQPAEHRGSLFAH